MSASETRGNGQGDHAECTELAPKGGVSRRTRIEHFLVSLAISGVCCLIFTAASLKAVLSFVIVYGLCWSARGVAAGLNRLFRRPALAGDPHVYWLMREFGIGRLTLALVAFCLRFAPSNPDIDMWLLAIMALAMCSALQAAYEDISVFGLIRTSTSTGGAS